MFKKMIKEYKDQFSYLPWRKKRSLYNTLVSEIMLQQTTVSTVENHFFRFIEIFPTLQSIHDASEDDIVAAWRGLGYYRRARNLKKACDFIVVEKNGRIPVQFNKLKEIPGIGDYTASAIIAIGRNKKQLCVDANIERIFSRLFKIKEFKGLKLQKEIRFRFESEVFFKHKSITSYRDLNESLMDHGRVICQKRKPKCEICVLSSSCQAFQTQQVDLYPFEKEKKIKKESLNLLRILIYKNDKVLAYKKNDDEWLTGQFELPTYIISTSDKNLKQYPTWKKLIPKKSKERKSVITKYKINNFIVRKNNKVTYPRELHWIPVNKKNLLSSFSLKILEEHI